MKQITEIHLKQGDSPAKTFEANFDLQAAGVTTATVVVSELDDPYTVKFSRAVDAIEGANFTVHFTEEETADTGKWDLVIKADVPGIGPLTFPERAYIKMYVERNL